MYKSFNKALLAGLVVAATSMVSTNLFAESTVTSGAGTISTDARLDFRITIPRFLWFRVGTSATPLDSTIDLIDFDLTANPELVGEGTDVAGTGGDAGGGAVNTAIRSNAGQVTITENNNSGGAGLDNGAASVIPYTEILSSSSDAGNYAAPTLSDAGGNTSTPTLTVGNITVRSAVWTYTYDNSAVYEAGTYGTNLNGGRVTYTASSP